MTGNRLFAGNQLSGEMARIQTTIRSRIDAVGDDALLQADADAWAAGMADELRLDPPVVHVAEASLHPGDRVDVDCTNAAGISFGTSEFGHVIREGYELELQIPVSGDAFLLATQVLGAPPLPGGIRAETIVCGWRWPDVKGGPAFDAEVATYKNELQRGNDVLKNAIEIANAGIPDFAIEQIEARRSSILGQRDFLGSLTIPVVTDAEAPREFDAPPPIERRRTAATKLEAGRDEPPEREMGPQLDEFYGHILGVIRAVGRALERSPGTFSAPARKPSGTTCWSP
ncbi:MAG: hypothetical protein JSU06_00335 [Actinobacteria bacterium]|nr:hypothetical protein [Actinomycetota bacterium]